MYDSCDHGRSAFRPWDGGLWAALQAAAALTNAAASFGLRLVTASHEQIGCLSQHRGANIIHNPSPLHFKSQKHNAQ